MNKEERIRYYLGDIICGIYDDYERDKKDKNGVIKKIDLEKMTNIDNIKLVKDLIIPDKVPLNIYNIYSKPLYDKLKGMNIDMNKRIGLECGDICYIINTPLICKNRIEGKKSSVIIRCMSYNRHWNNYYKRQEDIDFNDKINKVIWRGSSTGSPNAKANRFKFVETWCDKDDDIDIGLTNLCQKEWHDKDYSKYLKDKMSIRDMLKYKYVVSIQGNDKDSGLQWKLNSNSLVMMAKPTVTSWLMEDTLIPDYHYVLLKDDFSDLREKYDWCEANEERCKEIVKNAGDFMRQFEDEYEERKLEEEVIRRYIEVVN